MSTSKPVTTIPSERPGRPRSVRKRAEALIGSAGVEALRINGLAVVPANLVKELALFCEPSAAEVAAQPEQPKDSTKAAT
jgi:hypothetical protein